MGENHPISPPKKPNKKKGAPMVWVPSLRCVRQQQHKQQAYPSTTLRVTTGGASGR